MMNKRKANTRGLKRMLLAEKCRHLSGYVNGDFDTTERNGREG